MIKNSQQRIEDSSPREMFERDCILRFVEGLKLAISCAKELEAIQPKMGWKEVAIGLEGMIVTGKKLAASRPVTRGALLLDAARIQKTLDVSNPA